ncbi:MAG TPA: ChaN family lipoprotein [Candidatus Krumholzibacteria bacterium]|nr:ChaN family lipoprotein [Candidatus Krumholzibacteria bacterium]
MSVRDSVFLACVAAWLAASTSHADEPVLVDLEALNRAIGTDYQGAVTYDELVEEALASPLVLLGVVHDQECSGRQVQRLALELQQKSDMPVRLGIEFVDRDDDDILQAFLAGTLDEEGFLARVYPTSLLLSPQVGRAHLEILRFARVRGIGVLPLESRPSGARSRTLRNAEIRWNLSRQLGRAPGERLLVLYGVDHVFGPDDVAAGLDVEPLVVTSYADSVQAAFHADHGRYPRPGEVLRLRPGVFLDPCEAPRSRRLLGIGGEGRENLLMAIESVYFGQRDVIDAVLDALDDPDVRWRRAANHALCFASDTDLGYDPEAEPEARRESQSRWRAWWAGRGAGATGAP